MKPDLRVATQRNAMSVDVEDYFQVAAFDNIIKPQDWDNHPFRVGDVTRRLLERFDENGVKATFFILGWVAERDPDLIKAIVERGHEVANHGYNHQKVFTQDRDTFFDDVSRSKKLLEDISGVSVRGYRAPSFSIDKRNEWAFDVLLETGHTYSSSTYPIAHDHYGVPDWPTQPHRLSNGLLEMPQATVEKWGRRLPVGGGGYFRLFPLWLSQYLQKQFHEQHDHPFIFYFHPWEIDPEQPRFKDASLKSKFRHYVNLDKMERKIIKMCQQGDWTTISSAFELNVPGGLHERY